MAKDIEAGRAFVRLSIKEDLKALKNISRKLKAWGASLQSFSATMFKSGALMLAPFIAAIREVSKPGEALADGMTRAKESVLALMGSVGEQLVPILAPLIERFIEIVDKTAEWVKQNGHVVRTIFKVIAGVVAASAALFVVAKVLIILGTVLGALSVVLSFLMSPIGIVIALLAAGAAAFIKFTEAGRDLAVTLRTAFGGIADALKAGNIELAAEIAWVGLKLAFFKIIETIREHWLKFNKWFIDSLLGFGEQLVGGIPGLDRWLDQIKEYRRAVNDQFADDVSQGADRIAELERELARLRAQAAAEAHRSKYDKRGKPVAVRSDITSAGTFSAAAARIMFKVQRDDYASRTADATEETVRLLNRRTMVVPAFAA